MPASNSYLIIHNYELSDSFFKGTELWGITSALSIYKLCYLINNCFDINMIRKMEYDIAVKLNKDYSKMNGLFKNIDQEPQNDKDYFPVFSEEYIEGESDITLYCNKFRGKVLVQELSAFDFLLLTRNCESIVQLTNIDEYLHHEPDIIAVKLIETKGKKWRDSLIF